MSHRWFVFGISFCHFFLTAVLSAQNVVFTNIADSLGIQHIYTTGHFWGGGISFADFDSDGVDDLSLTSSDGESVYLFRNQSDHFLNVVADMPITADGESKSITWADYDNDGDRDLFITSFLGNNTLYRNDGGSQYLDVTAAAGISMQSWPSMGACWGDYDNDGWLDLYVLNYSNAPGFGETRNFLYRNSGDGTFEDVTLASNTADEGKYAFIAVFFDYNNDGWPDIYIANDREPENTLLKNLGDGTFEDVSVASHSNLDFEAMGIAVGDYNDDGWLDLYVSNGPFGNGLLRNNGDGTFTDVAAELGVLVGKSCWGVNFFDFDNDSDLDLYVSASHGPTPGSTDRQNVLFENLGDGTFSDASGRFSGNHNSESYGNAIGDYNNDGYPDIAVLNARQNSALWANSGGTNNWIKLKLTGAASNRDGVGSRIDIHFSGRKIMRTTHCGISFNSQNSTVETIGVGTAAEIDSLIVTWPSGISDVLRNIPVNERIDITEGQQITGITDVEETPEHFALFQNYPNPFNPETVIAYSLRQSGQITLTIHNSNGQLVKTLMDGFQSSGNFEVQWDGRDQHQRDVSSGIYFYKISVISTTGSFNNIAVQQTKKMLLLR